MLIPRYIPNAEELMALSLDECYTKTVLKIIMDIHQLIRRFMLVDPMGPIDYVL